MLRRAPIRTQTDEYKHYVHRCLRAILLQREPIARAVVAALTAGPGAALIRIERWDERTRSVVVSHGDIGADLHALLAEAVDMLGGAHDRHPTVTLCRPDGSSLSLSSDGRRCLVVWTDSLEESAHSVGRRPGPGLVFDYCGSYSEAPNEWTVPIADAIECAQLFARLGAPDSDKVLFEPD